MMSRPILRIYLSSVFYLRCRVALECGASYFLLFMLELFADCLVVCGRDHFWL